MAKNLLFEIGTEEIPAKFMPDTLEQIKTIAKNKFDENRIAYKDIKSYGTPRRITLFAEGLEEYQSDIDELVKGPSKKVAYDENGNPGRALTGFLNSVGADKKDVVIQKINDVEYIYARKREKGKPADEILTSLLAGIITSINFPKSMRWRTYDLRFARPIRWMLALYGEKVIEVSIEGLKSSNVTRGHRTLSNNDIVIKSADDYIGELKKAYVIVDPKERKDIIIEQINRLAKSKSGRTVIDEELLEEVIYLVEYPTGLIGNFEDEFLELPKEAVITSMKEHQRYFPVVDDNNNLLPYFITIRNGNDEFIDIVRVGNERVLRARLKDAQFFYNEDLKHKLEDRVESLKTIVYQEKLGTIYDKVERIAVVAEFLGNKFNLSSTEMQNLKRAAYLCKADLVTGMVNEFDELQGVMGREYALKGGEPKDVAEAIFTHYLPRFSGDDTPKDIFGQILSISDKLDSIVGSFGIGVQPTGSQDPYGLRRSALGIIKIILDNNLSIDIEELTAFSADLFDDRLTVEKISLKRDLMTFFKQRLKGILTDAGYRYDLVDAVLDVQLGLLGDVKLKLDSVIDQENREEFNQFLMAILRVSNISSKASVREIKESLFENESERSLYSKVLKADKEVSELINNKEFGRAIVSLYQLTDSINQFFESTMIMVDNEEVKNNRLALLNMLSSIALQICDFTKIITK